MYVMCCAQLLPFTSPHISMLTHELLFMIQCQYLEQNSFYLIGSIKQPPVEGIYRWDLGAGNIPGKEHFDPKKLTFELKECIKLSSCDPAFNSDWAFAF